MNGQDSSSLDWLESLGVDSDVALALEVDHDSLDLAARVVADNKERLRASIQVNIGSDFVVVLCGVLNHAYSIEVW